MKVSKVIKINNALEELRKLKLPYKAARNIKKLSSVISEEINIIIDQERQWISKCNGNLENDVVKFTDEEKGDEYGKWRSDMLKSEVDIVLPECDLSDYVDQITISPSALSILEGIIKFEKE